MNLRKRLTTLAAGAVLAAAGYTTLSAAALPAPAGATALTVAYVGYSITGDCVGTGGCTTHITILSNPSNGGVRAWEECYGNGTPFFLYGSWHYSVGTISNTGSCKAVRSGTFAEYAGFDYPKSPTVQYQCYSWWAGNSKSGDC